MLRSGKILVGLVNIDSVSEQDGNSLFLITGLQSCLGFSSKKAFAWKALTSCGNHYFDYPSWSVSIPKRATSLVACCLSYALLLSCYMTLLKTFIGLFSFLNERKCKLKIWGQDELCVCVRYYCLTINKGLTVLWCMVGWLGTPASAVPLLHGTWDHLQGFRLCRAAGDHWSIWGLLGPFLLPKLLGQKASSFLAIFCVGCVTDRCCWRGTGRKPRWEAAFGLDFFLGTWKAAAVTKRPGSCPCRGSHTALTMAMALSILAHPRQRPQLSHPSSGMLSASTVRRPHLGRGEACS